MKILTIIGARPQFIKASAFSREANKHDNIEEVIIHTGQHFDANMSDIFFEEMGIPKPKYNLNIHSLSHGAMTGRMLEEIETILIKEKPDWVLVYGDTNSTLAGALAATKLHVKLAHVEAGLRSHNTKMPEEINRILTDRISDLLFCPTETAVKNLEHENLKQNKIIRTGDIMYDSALYFKQFAKKPKANFNNNFILATLHRAENTDDKTKLESIVSAINSISAETQIVIPLHPRTKEKMKHFNLSFDKTVQSISPVGYLEMLWLLENCSMVMTDSGGLQKEAYFFQKACICMREETEWTELVEHNINQLTGSNYNKIHDAYQKFANGNNSFPKNLYGTGDTSALILNEIQKI
ncbi:MAG: UDP-N-acetylglucosamine 2-epimerase (non-hydrolyzing) [Bacteroidales bacterium]|jgi:UDP-GlcNAc3NAcA epimerase|nr:UDP-N-acetylglucosamine 2-epimerase (non-hydrolyzing) [Bacteroidales bacterium]